MKRAAIVFALAALTGSLPGCIVSTNDSAVVSTGTLTVSWTINGSSDPNQCNQSVVSDIDILVTSPDSAIAVGDFAHPCSDGVTTITLDPGTYAADAALVDSAGVERTTRVHIDTFAIHGNSDLSIGVDFPASSFH